MENPFEELREQLNRIEALVVGQNQTTQEKVEEKPSLQYIPIKEIIGVYCCRTTFYKHVRSGKIVLHKLDGKSFVKKDEFEGAFQEVKVG